MSSVQPASLVVLDRCLADFYNDDRRYPHERVILVGVYPAGLRKHTLRYVCHDSNYKTIAANGQVNHDDEVSRTRVHRALGSFKFSMCAGNIELIVFNVENCPSFARQFQENLSVIDPSQIPTVSLLSSPGLLKSNKNNLNSESVILANRLPLDELRGMPVVFDCDVHYEFLSKRGLANAPFKTPACRLVDLGTEDEISAFQACNARRIPMRIVSRYKDEATALIARGNLPFVVKLQQTVSGNGTWIIKNGIDRARIISLLPYLLDENVERTNKGNMHLRPATIVVSDFVQTDPKDTISYAITFFVKREGSTEDEKEPGVELVGVCAQDLRDDHSWHGASINYRAQSALKEKFSAIVKDVACYLSSNKYWGMVGIDVLEDVYGQMWVVDMNVRPPGSLILCLLSNHFSATRGFHHASLIAKMKMAVNKDAFIFNFADDIDQGCLVINAWFYDESENEDWASFVVAGKTMGVIAQLIQCIRLLEV